MEYLYTLLFFLLPLCFVSAGPSYHMMETSTVLPLHIRNKLILVEGQVNNKRGYFLFDTGASELILNKVHFPRYKYSSAKKYFVGAGGQSILSGYAFIESFRWGGVRRDTFLAPRIDLRALERRLGEQLLGIIGYDVLRHVDLELDYHRQTITLFRPGHPPATHVHPPLPDYTFYFQMDHHLPVLRANLGDAEGLNMAIDSGSSVNVCTQRLQRKLKSKALQQRKVDMEGAGGGVEKSPYYIMESLEVENTYSIAFCRVALGDLEAIKAQGFQIDGLLGVNFFRLGRVFLSYRFRRIAVWLEHNDYTMRHSPLLPVEGMSAE